MSINELINYMLSEIIFPLIILIVLIFSLIQYNESYNKIVDEQMKLAKERNKLLNDIKTQLMILNAINRKNDS